jgi:hypothetical protein
VENIILPELKEVEVDYYRTYTETVNYYYRVDLKSFSKKRGIINNFFRYEEGADCVDIDNYQEYDKEHHDTEFLDGGINDIN